MSSSSAGSKSGIECGLVMSKEFPWAFCQENIGQRLLEAAREMDSDAIRLYLPHCNRKDKWQAAFCKLMECSLPLKGCVPFHQFIQRVDFEECVRLFVNDLRFQIPYGKILQDGQWDPNSFSLHTLSTHLSGERVDSWFGSCGYDAVRHIVSHGNWRQLDRIIEEEVAGRTFAWVLHCMMRRCSKEKMCFDEELRERFDKMLAASQGQSIDVLSIFLKILRQNFHRVFPVFVPLVRAFIQCHVSFMKASREQEMQRAREVVRANILPLPEAQSVLLPFLMPAISRKQIRLVKNMILGIEDIQSEYAGRWRRRCDRRLIVLRNLKKHLKKYHKFDPASVDPAELEPGDTACENSTTRRKIDA